MNKHLALLLLQVQIFLRNSRLLSWLIPALLLLAALGQFYYLPQLQSQQQTLQQALLKAKLSLSTSKPVPTLAPEAKAERDLLRFYHALGEKEYVEQQINSLFAIANKQGLQLRQGEYKLTVDKNGGFSTYQAILPLKGTYPQLRQFCEQALLQIEFAALDEISIKREQIGNANLDARIKLSFYLNDINSMQQVLRNAERIEAQVGSAQRGSRP